jgi:hypothetical protein
VEEFKYFGTTLTNQNPIQKEIKSRLESGNACYQLVYNPLSSSLLLKNLKVKTYRTPILPVILYGYETWLLTVREECRVLRKIFGPKGDKVTGEWRKLHNEELYDQYSSPNIVLAIKLRRIRWVGHVAHRGGKERCIKSFGGET